VEAVRFHDNEKRLISGCAAGIIKVWDIEESKSLLPFSAFPTFAKNWDVGEICRIFQIYSQTHIAVTRKLHRTKSLVND